MLTETAALLAQEQQAPRRRRWLLVLALSVAAALVLAVVFVLNLLRTGRPLVATPFTLEIMAGGGEVDSPEVRLQRATKEFERLQPRGPRIVIDTYRNRVRLMKDNEVLRTAVCSTGTGIVLRDPRNGRQWIFDTPLGERVVEKKVKNPIWAKPDWAFIEEGYLPPKDPAERFDSVSLGDYALYIGDGYIIHGTLFKSLLGRRVTHGCVRLGDEDLEFIYRHAPLGTRVYLY